MYIIYMYNSKIKGWIDKYRKSVQHTEHFKMKNKTWSKECFDRMKAEGGERYERKKTRNRLRYYTDLKKKDIEKYKNALDRLKKKDIEFYEKVIGTEGTEESE